MSHRRGTQQGTFTPRSLPTTALNATLCHVPTSISQTASHAHVVGAQETSKNYTKPAAKEMKPLPP